jgi:hypothetical protein
LRADDGRLSRRGFIGGCVALAGLGLGVSGCRNRAELLEEGRRLTAGITEREHWAIIGRSYLDGSGLKLGDLVEQLGAAGGSGEPGQASPPLADRVRLDFEQGRTIRVDGWVLAETEARMAAVVALVDG